MPERLRRGTVRHVLVWGLAILVVSMLAACAGPGGEGLATIGAAATANDRLTTPGGTASATGSAAAATGTIAGRTVAAASSAGAATMGTAARSPVAAGSMTVATPVGIASATGATRPATGGSSTAAAASAMRPTTGSVTAGGAATPTRPGTTTASTGMIPPPPNGMEYVQGTNMIIDTILMAAEQGLSSSSDSVSVTSSKDYVSSSTAMDVGAFYRMQMPPLGWKSEQDQNSASGITTLVFSRDNQTNAALILIVDLSQVNQKGCLVITATAKPK